MGFNSVFKGLSIFRKNFVMIMGRGNVVSKKEGVY
jgi:hypothetical protein